MISCTEFIPAYSELFKFIDQNSGRQAVYDYWAELFKPENSPLNEWLDKCGFRGCWEYWSRSLTEEDCDFTMYFNEKQGWFSNFMHECPSKGRFLKCKDLTPFDEYCKHCDNYSIVLSKHGLKHLPDYRGVDGSQKAQCREIIWDPNVFQGDPQAMLDEMWECVQSGRKYLAAEDTLVMDVRKGENKYFHRLFHTSTDYGCAYITEKYGLEGLRKYLTQYTLAYHKTLIEDIKSKGLQAMVDYLIWLYETEEAPEVLHIATKGNPARSMTIHIDRCPVIDFYKSIGHKTSKYFVYTTSMVYEALAEAAGIQFKMLSYDEQTGEADYRFLVHQTLK